jgi:ribosomal protein S18 acetylase RimI-like enzyme
MTKFLLCGNQYPVSISTTRTSKTISKSIYYTISFVCKLYGKIIGTIMCGNDGRRAFIYHLAVAPEERRRGIGAELVRLAIQEQKLLGIKKFALFILNNNTSGKEFWMRMGFSDVQEAGAMAKNI